MKPKNVTSSFIIENYQTILLDAYGVLVNADLSLPGARKFLLSIEQQKKNYFVVSNGSAQSPSNSAKEFNKKGLDIPPEKIINSGSLVCDWIKENNLEHATVYILGPKSSHFVVEGTSCKICNSDAKDFDLLIVTNQTGFPFLDGLNHVISSLFWQIDSGKSCRLLLPNPDLIYPGSNGFFGCTSGMIAKCIEEALALRYYSQAPTFAKLGKPYEPIFQKARQLADTDSLVMIGDQIETDIKGAIQANIDTALIETGVSSKAAVLHQESKIIPKYILSHL